MEFIAINFNKHFLPVFAGFVSGLSLGWMVGDNNARRHFYKYHIVQIPQAPMHTFYAYARDEKELTQIQATLAETHGDVENIYRQKQQSKASALH
jgi:hypothetical protein